VRTFMLALDRIQTDSGAVGQVDEECLQEQCRLIRERGVSQPVEVVKVARGRFRLVFGEVGYLAASMTGLTAVPAIVRRHMDVHDPGSQANTRPIWIKLALPSISACPPTVDSSKSRATSKMLPATSGSIPRVLSVPFALSSNRPAREGASTNQHITIPQVKRRLDDLSDRESIRWRDDDREALAEACYRFLVRWAPHRLAALNPPPPPNSHRSIRTDSDANPGCQKHLLALMPTGSDSSDMVTSE
jgi:ParB-like nuclease domain